jgi:hypothetical protein
MSADLAAVVDRLTAVATELERKATAVNNKVRRLLQQGKDGGSSTPRDGPEGEDKMDPAEAVPMMKKAMAAITQLCVDQAGAVKALLPNINDASAKLTAVADSQPVATTPPVATATPTPVSSPSAGGAGDDAMEAKLKVALAEKELLRNDLEQLQQNFDEKTADLTKVREALKAVEADFVQHKSAASAAIEHERAETQVELLGLQQQLVKHEEEKAAAEERTAIDIAALHAQHESLRQTLEAKMAVAETTSRELIAQRDEKAKKLQAEIDKLKSAVQLAETEAKLSCEAAAAEEARAREAIAERDAAKEAQHKAEVELKASQHTVEALHAAMRQAKEHVHVSKLGMEQEARGYKQKIHELELELESLRGRLLDDHLRELVRKQQQDIDDVRVARIEDARKLSDALNARGLTMASEARLAPLILSPVRDDDSRAGMAKLRHEIADMEVTHLGEVRALETQIHMLTTDLSIAQTTAAKPASPLKFALDFNKPILMNVACQADDDALRRALMVQAALQQQLEELTEDSNIIREELSSRVADLESQLAMATADNSNVVDALTNQIRVLQFKVNKAKSEPAEKSRSPSAPATVRDPIDGSASPPDQPRPHSSQSHAHLQQEAAALQRAAAALDEWRAQVERENAGLRMELEIQKAKVKALRRELDHQRDDYEVRIARMSALFEGQTRSIVEQSNLQKDMHAAAMSARSVSSMSASQQQQHQQQQQGTSSASPSRSVSTALSPEAHGRLSRMRAIDDELLLLHEEMLAFDTDSAAARQRIDDAQEHVTRELQRGGSAQRYWERQGDAAAAQEEQALIEALVTQQGERAHELTELLAFVQTERKRLVEKSNALLHERTRLTVGSGNSAVPR